MGDSLQELSSLVVERAAGRLALIVSAKDLRLDSADMNNSVYVLELARSTAAGGRTGGFGQRSIERVYRFLQKEGLWTKDLEVAGDPRLDDFQPPFHVAIMPVVLQDGKEIVVLGIVDEELVSEYDRRFGRSGTG